MIYALSGTVRSIPVIIDGLTTHLSSLELEGSDDTADIFSYPYLAGISIGIAASILLLTACCGIIIVLNRRCCRK